MGNCVQCYPCIVKSNNLENFQSSLYIPPVIDDMKEKEQKPRESTTTTEVNNNTQSSGE